MHDRHAKSLTASSAPSKKQLLSKCGTPNVARRARLEICSSCFRVLWTATCATPRQFYPAVNTQNAALSTADKKREAVLREVPRTRDGIEVSWSVKTSWEYPSMRSAKNQPQATTPLDCLTSCVTLLRCVALRRLSFVPCVCAKGILILWCIAFCFLACPCATEHWVAGLPAPSTTVSVYCFDTVHILGLAVGWEIVLVCLLLYVHGNWVFASSWR